MAEPKGTLERGAAVAGQCEPGKIMGPWIFRKDRWMMCVQTKEECYERHAQGKGDCECRLCKNSKKWPRLLSTMLQKFVPGGWQGDT